MEIVARSFSNLQAHRNSTRTLPSGVGVPGIWLPKAVGEASRNTMTVRLDHIFVEEGKVDVRLERFVASADAVGGRDQDTVVVFVSRGTVRHGRSARMQQCHVASNS